MADLSSREAAARAIDDPAFAQEVLDSNRWPDVADAIRKDLAAHAATTEPEVVGFGPPPEPVFVGTDPPEPDFQFNLGSMWNSMGKVHLHNLSQGH